MADFSSTLNVSQELEPEAVEDGDEDCVSTEQLVEKLEEAWLNEKFSPELLPYQGDVVDCLIDQLTHMQENLQRIDKADFRVTVHKMELERIQYIMTSYLKIRLGKIEQHGAFILSQLDNEQLDLELLSPEERRYARAYVSSLEDYFRDVALVHMPHNQQSFNMSSTGKFTNIPHFAKYFFPLPCKVIHSQDVIVEIDGGPDMDEYVFLKVKRRVLGVLVDEGTSDARDGEIVDLDQGSQHIMRYRVVSTLIKDGSVVLF